MSRILNLKRFCTLTGLLVVFLYCHTGYTQKNDTIVLKNNDRLIGEIKEMRNGILNIGTSYSSSDFRIKWINIKKISSSKTYTILLTKGERLSAVIKIDSTDTDRILFEYEGKKISAAINDIIYIKSSKSGFLSRLDASLSFGFNYTKSNDLRQLTVRSNIAYTSDFWAMSGSYNSVESSQTDAESVSRIDASVAFRYFLRNNYFLNASSEFLSNDEQKLKLRILAKAGFGKYFVYTNKLYLGGTIGLAGNNEQYLPPDNISRNSLESFLSAELNLFDIKKFSLLTTGTGYVSLTESSRFRADYKIDLKYDLPYDFFIKFGFTLNYDNKPVEDASDNDYIFQTTFGWEL